MQLAQNQISSVCEQAERLLASGAPADKVLHLLASAVDSMFGETSVSSILRIDEDGLLRNGASPGLPADYLEKIDKLRPHPQVGTCAAAAALGEVVYTPDLQDDNKWAELRHFPLALGSRGPGACRCSKTGV